MWACTIRQVREANKKKVIRGKAKAIWLEKAAWHYGVRMGFGGWQAWVWIMAFLVYY